MRSTFRIFLFALISSSSAVSLGACSSSGSDTGTVAAFNAHFSSFFCDIYHTCSFHSDGGGVQLAGILGLSTDACERYTSGFDFKFYANNLETYVEEGSILYSPSAAEACLDQIATVCNVPSIGMFTTGVCADVFTGTRAIGAPCFIDDQCAGEAYCTAPLEEHNTTCTAGTCAARLAPGATCTREEQCERAPEGGSDCVYVQNSSNRACARVTLNTDLQLGEVCGQVVSVSGQSEGICAPGLYCRRSANDVSQCAAPVADGATCDPASDACSPQFACVDDGTGGKCIFLDSVNTAGGACDARHICNVFLGLNCVAGACVSAVGNGTLGAVCRDNEAAALDCNEGLYCDETTLHCAALKADGIACESERECTSRDCDRDAGVCVTRTYCH